MSTGTWEELKNEIKQGLARYDMFPDWPAIAEDLCERIEKLTEEKDALETKVERLEQTIKDLEDDLDEARDADA